MSKLKKLLSSQVDTIIVLLIAACLIFINGFTVRKLNELEHAGKSAIFIKDDIQVFEDETLSEEIRDFIPEAYKMIELYDENLDLLFQAKFVDVKEPSTKTDIKKYSSLTDILYNNEEGQTSLTINDEEQNIYFKWVMNSRNEHRLLIVYSSIKQVSGIWIFSLMCYITLILVFVLLIRIRTASYHDKIRQYKDMTEHLRNEFKN